MTPAATQDAAHRQNHTPPSATRCAAARTAAAASAASDNYLKLRSDAYLDWYD